MVQSEDREDLLPPAEEVEEAEDTVLNDVNVELALPEIEQQQQQNQETALVQKLKKIPLSGFVLVLVSCSAMTLAGVLVKELSAVDPFVLTGYRNCIIFLCSAIRLGFYRIDPEPPGKKKLLLARAVFLTIYSSTLYYSFRYLPIGDVRTLTAAQPMLVTLCACVCLREKCGLTDVLALVSTVVGMVLVTHPPLIFGELLSAAPVNYDSQYYIAAAAIIVGTVCQSFGFIITRSLKGVDYAVVTAWMGLFGTLPPLLLSVALGTFGLPAAKDTPYVLLVGVLSFMGQAVLTVALQVQEAGVASLVKKAADILLAFLVQVVFYKDIPDVWGIVGSVMITVTVLLVGARKLLTGRTENASGSAAA